MTSFVLIISIILLSALAAAVAQYIFKKNLPQFGLNASEIYHALTNRKMLGGLALYIASLIVYLFALKKAPLSFVYPTFASSFIFIAIISRFYLNEKINILRAAGIGLVILGIILIAITY